MKKILSVILGCILMLSLTACAESQPENGTDNAVTGGNVMEHNTTTAQETKAAEQTTAETVQETKADTPQQTSNALVVYFSWSGNTQNVADAIAGQTGAQLFEIVPRKAYTDDYNALLDIAAQEKENRARPEIAGVIDDIEKYDVIYVGYPNWWSDMPMILYTFFDSYDFSGKTIAPFCTSGGSGLSNTVNSIRELEPGANVLDGLHINGSSASNPDDAVSGWLDSLGIVAENSDAGTSSETEHTEDSIMKITAGNTTFTATLADNSSVSALKELLAKGPLTINMNDYAGMEKVGAIGTSLPRNDEQISTGAGDIILYQGSSLVIYYNTNSWNFTRIGKIEGVTGEELLEAFGTGDVTVTFFLE